MQQRSRRQFVRLLAGFAAVPGFAKTRGLALDAIAAPRLPHRLMVDNMFVDNMFVGNTDRRAAIFEVRVYADPSRAMQSILERHGIRPTLLKHSATGTAYLIPFESLGARQRAWDAFNTDPAWHAIRACAAVNLKEISLYRVAG